MSRVAAEPMLIAILQALLTVAACFGLWRVWRVLDGRGVLSRIIAAGFLLRALGAQLLFWISWLRLPVARSLQVGNGFWWFALDGITYLNCANLLLSRGVKAILFIEGTYPSRVYVQWFTLFAAAFGTVASTAILFNCAAYLATCALILRVGSPRAGRSRVFALAAIAFGPTTILWTLQPLKDTFFTLLIAATIALCDEWQRLWQDAAVPARRMLLCAGAMVAAVYAIAGTRWYVGGIVAGGSLIFLALVANLPRLRLFATLVAAVLFLTLVQAFRLGGAPDFPLAVQNAMNLRTLFQPPTESATKLLASTRQGFETTPGATSIAPGSVLLHSAVPAKTKSGPPAAVAASPAPAASRQPNAAVRSAQETVAGVKPVETSTSPADRTPAVPSATNAAPPVSDSVPAVTPATNAAPLVSDRVPAVLPATNATPPVSDSAPAVLPAANTALIGANALPAAAPVKVGSSGAPVAEPVAAITTTASVEKKPVAKPAIKRRRADVVRSVPVAAVPLQPSPKSTPVAVVAPAPALNAPAPPPPPRLAAKIMSGAAATFVPRAVAQPLGLVQIGGGRGFWLFADADTLVFDFVIVCAFGYCAWAVVRRRRHATPLFILVVLVFAAIAGPMIYTVTNFGTLFRLRGMLYVLAAFLPLTLSLPERAR